MGYEGGMALTRMSSRGDLTFGEVVGVARGGNEVALTDDARTALEASAAVVRGLVESGEPVYGVSTGFGSLATIPIPAERRAELQRSLIRSHAAGMGRPSRARSCGR